MLSAWLLGQSIQPTADAGQLLDAAQSHATVTAVAGPDALRWGLLLVGLSFTFIAIPAQTLMLEALKGEALATSSSLFFFFLKNTPPTDIPTFPPQAVFRI